MPGMTDFTSAMVTYHAQSPDPVVPHCANTGEVGDGVTFDNVEPMVGYNTFVGRTSIVEAAALLYGLTPSEVEQRLSGTAKPRQRGKGSKELD